MRPSEVRYDISKEKEERWKKLRQRLFWVYNVPLEIIISWYLKFRCDTVHTHTHTHTHTLAQLAGAVEYTDCTSAEG